MNNENDDTNDLLKSIYKQNKKKELNKVKTYNIILDKCKKKIKWAADNEQYFIIFELPRFTFNCPLYNLDECCFYIKQKLEKKFQIVHFTPEHLIKLHNNNNNNNINENQLTHILIISWNHIKEHFNKLYY